MQHVASEFFMETDVYVAGVHVLDRALAVLPKGAFTARIYRLAIVALTLAFKWENGFECGAPPPFKQLSVKRHWTQMAAALNARLHDARENPTSAKLLAKYEIDVLRALQHQMPSVAPWHALVTKHASPETQHTAAVVLRYATFVRTPHAFATLARVVDSLVLQRALAAGDIGGHLLLSEFRSVVQADDFPIDTDYLFALCPRW